MSSVLVRCRVASGPPVIVSQMVTERVANAGGGKSSHTSPRTSSSTHNDTLQQG